MSVEEKFNSGLQKIIEIYLFLTEGNPSPDDEIEAREQMIASFNNLKTINPSSKLIDRIEKILNDLRNWDSLELWFSETTLLNDVKDILGLPDKEKFESGESTDIEPELLEEKKISEPDIDLTDIFTKVSDQFKDEIDNLKGKIEDLKKELENKNQTLKSVRETKKVKKITPKRDVKLPPPIIRIPVIKKSVPPTHTSPTIKPELISESEPPKNIDIKLKPITPKFSDPNKTLTPIPTKTISNNTQEEHQILSPIPADNSELIFGENQIPKEKPIRSEKRRIIPIVTEEVEQPTELPIIPEEEKIPFKLEKPFISSVKIEEVESESIKSSGTDLFNVFSSVGGKEDRKKTEPKKHSEPKLSTLPPKMNQIEKKPNEETKPAVFIDFTGSKEAEKTPKFTSGEELSDNKDTLYQELIALEGRRYSLEKNFKELDKLYNKGSIADAQYKNESDSLKNKLGEITSRIYKIRRIISSL